MTRTGACPVDCRYCVITQVEDRRDLWQQRTILGINKAVTILNPPLVQDAEADREFFAFPVELLRGDFVGFNAISDPFWRRYDRHLRWFLEHVAPIAKLVTCVTKMSPAPDVLDLLATIPNFRLVVSITGLDTIEKTKPRHRLALLAAAKQRGIQAYPIIHPYIAGMSDLGFLDALRKLGYQEVDVKGLRYDTSMDAWMPPSVQEHYRGTEGTEVLPEDGWKERVQASGLRVRSLKAWYHDEFDVLLPKLDEAEATHLVQQVIARANVTSSDTDEAVITAAVRRRL